MRAVLTWAWRVAVGVTVLGFPIFWLLQKLHGQAAEIAAGLAFWAFFLSWPLLCFLSASLVWKAPAFARWGARLAGGGMTVLIVITVVYIRRAMA